MEQCSERSQTSLTLLGTTFSPAISEWDTPTVTWLDENIGNMGVIPDMQVVPTVEALVDCLNELDVVTPRGPHDDGPSHRWSRIASRAGIDKKDFTPAFHKFFLDVSGPLLGKQCMNYNYYAHVVRQFCIGIAAHPDQTFCFRLLFKISANGRDMHITFSNTELGVEFTVTLPSGWLLGLRSRASGHAGSREEDPAKQAALQIWHEVKKGNDGYACLVIDVPLGTMYAFTEAEILGLLDNFAKQQQQQQQQLPSSRMRAALSNLVVNGVAYEPPSPLKFKVGDVCVVQAKRGRAGATAGHVKRRQKSLEEYSADQSRRSLLG
mmetsp:Transcript_23005/g.38498  ORF Transcript_23005/g.38498 Transcript_23005/m.38498 type:complete len:322 (-) Transcript_23005:549-1514(-)